MLRAFSLAALTCTLAMGEASAFEAWAFKAETSEFTATIATPSSAFSLGCDVDVPEIHVGVFGGGIAADRKLQVPFTIRTSPSTFSEVLLDCDIVHTCSKTVEVKDRDFSALTRLAEAIRNGNGLRITSGGNRFDASFSVNNAQTALKGLLDRCK